MSEDPRLQHSQGGSASDRRPPVPGGPPPGYASTQITTFAGYELLCELGRGSGGTVFLARRAGAPLVALKVLAAQEASDPEGRARFQREATVSARVAHEGIVRVLDAGESQGRPYIAMEFVAGMTLRERVGGQALPPVDAARIVGALARALEASHAAGVVHRDLKPGNVLLDRAGRPRLADFGLARDELAPEKLTRSGDRLGTPVYMAPEQIAGKRADRAIDVWALGVILWECLVGHPPFSGKSVPEVFEKIESWTPVAPSREAPYPVPPELDRICLEALARKSTDRPTAGAVAADLEAVLDDLASPRPTTPAARAASPALLALALAGGTLLGAAVTFLAEHGRGERAIARASADAAVERAAASKRLDESEEKARRAADEARHSGEEARRADTDARRLATELEDRSEQLGRERLSWGDTTGVILDHVIASLDEKSGASAARLRARLLLARRRPDEAVASVRAARAAHPELEKDAELLRLEADSLDVAMAEAMLASPETTDLHARREEADRVLTRLAGLPDATDARVVYARAKLSLERGAGSPDQVFDDLLRSHDLDRSFAAGLFLAGRLALQSEAGSRIHGALERAIAAVRTGIEADPTSGEGYYMRSTAAWHQLHLLRARKKDLPPRLADDCVRDLQRARAINGDPRHTVEEGKVAVLFGRPHDAALPIATVIDRARPGSVQWVSAVSWRGNMKMALGDGRAAIEDWLLAAEASTEASTEIALLFDRLPADLRAELIRRASRSRTFFQSLADGQGPR